MSALGLYIVVSLVILIACLWAWIAFVTYPYSDWSWLVTKPDQTSVKLFKFLRITMSSFPWQESNNHAHWRASRKMIVGSTEFHDKYEPRYCKGWKDCGTSFNRTLGFSLTSRQLRLDVFVGIIFITWRDWPTKKPTEKS